METRVIKADSLEDALVTLKEEAEKLKGDPNVSMTEVETMKSGPALCIRFELFGYDVRLCIGWVAFD